MNEAEVQRYKAILTAKQTEITGKSRKREDIWIVKSNEQIETVQMAGEREFAVRVLEHDREVLIQIEAALERIKDREYGMCVECEDPISPKRLAALPWAACCVHCQELHDAQGATAVRPQMAA